MREWDFRDVVSEDQIIEWLVPSDLYSRKGYAHIESMLSLPANTFASIQSPFHIVATRSTIPDDIKLVLTLAGFVPCKKAKSYLNFKYDRMMGKKFGYTTIDLTKFATV